MPTSGAKTSFSRQYRAVARARFQQFTRNKSGILGVLAPPVISIVGMLVIISAIEASIPDAGSIGGDEAVPLAFRQVLDAPALSVPYLAAGTGEDDALLIPRIQPFLLPADTLESVDSVDELEARFAVRRDKRPATLGGWAFRQFVGPWFAAPLTSPVGAKVDLMYDKTGDRFSLPISVQLLDNAVIDHVTNGTLFVRAQDRTLPDSFPGVDIFVFVGPAFITFAAANLLATFAGAIVQDRERKIYFQLQVVGLTDTAYWLGHATVDLALFAITTALLFTFMAVSGTNAFLSTPLGIWLLSYGLFGITAVCVGYALSWLFSTHEQSQRIMNALISFVVFIPFFIANFAFENDPPAVYTYTMSAVFPTYSLYNIIRLLATSVFERNPLTFEECMHFDSGIPQMLLLMAAHSILSVLIVLRMDRAHRHGVSFWAFTATSHAEPVPTGAVRKQEEAAIINASGLYGRPDAGVKDELERAHRPGANTDKDTALVIQGLRKRFTSKAGKVTKVNVALKDLNLTIRRGECFGLLGPNGAGKSTTMSLLAGAYKPTRGRATVLGHDIETDMDSVHASMGLCQQVDALFDELTVQQHLELFAEIRGIAPEKVAETIEAAIKLLQLTDYRDVLTSTLSGGNKRKLSVALSTIGEPKVIFLDEPTTGMDPVTRRGMWTIIKGLSSRCTVVLTTHSMEEADALCDRVGILATGLLRMVGSIQTAKVRYGGEYKLSLRSDVASTEAVHQFITKSLYPSARLLQAIGGSRTYEVPVADVKLASVFEKMEAKRAALRILDWSVSQTTLEQVFLLFAAHQVDDSSVETKAGKAAATIEPGPGPNQA